MSYICLCCHCGERWKAGQTGTCAMFCPRCKTAEQRAAMDKENAELGNICKKCPMKNTKSTIDVTSYGPD